ncbi:MAG: hypothetical protein H6700_03520 [Myxococcales bacterium]|nr:hypothetical protein [Myxococcales bacterium]MCB9519462.1 hypothetical protein [Myxococcales bacterium]MCB9530810.1 hypothetical protein [Myxococcales bacterium]
MLRGNPHATATARSLDDDWIALAESLGFVVVREGGAYVTYDGAGTIGVAPYDDLDPDDCLAQIVLHELCHFAVEGVSSRSSPDWGLDNTTERDVPQEHAALVAQLLVLAPHHLEGTLAPTTDFRAWYDEVLAPLGPALRASLHDGVAMNAAVADAVAAGGASLTGAASAEPGTAARVASQGARAALALRGFGGDGRVDRALRGMANALRD